MMSGVQPAGESRYPSLGRNNRKQCSMTKRFTAAMVAASLGFFAVAAAPAQADGYLQCVPFARDFSGIRIFGDAWTWWGQAVNRFRTGDAPETGSVLVFRQNGRMTRGHVAVVSNIVSDRMIQITHANWGGSRGKVEEDVVVVDMSDANDWSRVKVWHKPSNDLGVTVYPTYGFIYRGDPAVAGDALQTASTAAAEVASR